MLLRAAVNHHAHQPSTVPAMRITGIVSTPMALWATATPESFSAASLILCSPEKQLCSPEKQEKNRAMAVIALALSE